MALHWRQRPELEDATASWAADAAQPGSGLELHPAKMAAELRPPVPVDKGDVVDRALRRASTAAAFAGDDAGDLTAFDALDRLQADGRARGTRCASRCASGEAPPELLARADVRVDGPAGLAALLAELAAEIRRAPA